jgi:hypothetical protein
MDFNKTSLDEFRKDFQAAVEAVEKKHQILLPMLHL